MLTAGQSALYSAALTVLTMADYLDQKMAEWKVQSMAVKMVDYLVTSWAVLMVVSMVVCLVE